MRVVYKKYNLVESGGGLDYYEIKESKKYGTYNSSFGKYGSYTFDRDSGIFTLEGLNGHYRDSAVDYSFLQSDSGSSNTRVIHIFSVLNGEIRYYSTLYSEKVAVSYGQGSYIGEVEAEDGYYPRNGRQNGYWYVWDRYANTAPTISGSYTDIGVVKKDFDITYIIKDADNDDVRVGIRVDNNVIQYPMYIPLNSTQTVRIKVDEYGLGQHTITVTATDSSNSSATRTYYFTKSNTAPTISGSNVNMGALYKDFDVDYIVQDADGDDVKVSILVDGYIKQSATPTSLGIRKYFHVDMNQYSLGRHRIEIVVEDGFGAESTRTITFEKVNSAPIISGRDENLGAKNTSFSYTYSVSDNEKDSVRVVERLNGNTIRTLTNASLNTDFSINITSEQIKKLDINRVNTIEIEASDGNATTFRRVTFSRNNMPPIISGKDVELGEKDKSLNYSYSATDPERDKIFATVYLDDKVLIPRKSIVDGASQNIKIDGLEFLKISKGNHRIEIVVEDDKGFKSTRTVRFTRTIARLVMELGNKGIDTGSTLAKRVLVSTVGIYVAKGAIAKYEVCNNAFDSNPTWEDATTMVNAGKAFNFQNKSKKATKAGINIRVSIEKGDSMMASYISSIGGSFD
ncbi:hypothetical protein [Finegoldia magna]|uniref:hypothetical protein n=1 Tax=Finegoldia magna TaxID=1260 RepID=UPI0023A9C981|nr:hypothetical protein [Finegoldia magna]MCC2717242.1 hypothetical protein [Finegoldia magna]